MAVISSRLFSLLKPMGFKAFHFPLTSQEAHSIIQGLQPHHGLVPELWSLSNITQRLVDQNKTSSLLYWKISSKISVGHLESLSSGQVSTSAIGNLAMKVSTSWRILGVTSPVHYLGHWQSISAIGPFCHVSFIYTYPGPTRVISDIQNQS